MRISLNIEMPPPPAPAATHKVEEKQTVEERVREAIEECESGRASRTEWIMLGRLRTSLLEMQKKASKDKKERITNLLGMINPLLSKYGFHGVSPKER